MENLVLPPAPDGGYGWVIVAAAFYISAVMNGLMFSLGSFLDSFVQV